VALDELVAGRGAVEGGQGREARASVERLKASAVAAAGRGRRASAAGRAGAPRPRDEDDEGEKGQARLIGGDLPEEDQQREDDEGDRQGTRR
jgi:hypothetical protein